MAKTLLIVAVLHADAEDKRYQLYSAAYGLEMQIDDEWKAELVLLAPHDHLAAVTEETDVTSEDTAICSAGVTDVPLTGGKPNLSAIRKERNNWLLVAGPDGIDSEEVIAKKLSAALAAGCRAVLCFDDAKGDQLANRLAGVDAKALPRLAIAYVGPKAADPKTAAAAAEHVQQTLQAKFSAKGACRFLVGGDVTAENVEALTSIPGVAGIFMEPKRYKEWGDILEILSVVGE
jgi:hypothetical protein